MPGNARVADRWSARNAGSPEAAEGCALSIRQQAVALCRVDRAQVRDAPAASAAALVGPLSCDYKRRLL